MRARTGRELSAEGTAALGIPAPLNIDKVAGQRAVRQHLPDTVWHAAMARFNVQVGWQSGVAA